MATARKKVAPKIVRVPFEIGYGQSVNPTTRVKVSPVFREAPQSAVIEDATGGTLKFTAYDPEAGTLTYTITTDLLGVTISDSTGQVTIVPPDNDPGQVGTITVTATSSASSLAASVSCDLIIGAGPVV